MSHSTEPTRRRNKHRQLEAIQTPTVSPPTQIPLKRSFPSSSSTQHSLSSLFISISINTITLDKP